jgi:hypothetical protein
MRRDYSARNTVLVAIPVVLGLVIGVIIAVAGGSSNSKLSETALGASASPSAANVNCDIIVPANPLSARGLATPYQLTGTDGLTIDFGFNGTDLFQVGTTRNALRNGNCVNGTSGSIFGQVSFCNGINFFNVAFRAERQGRLVVPSEGTSTKIIASGGTLGSGQNCPDTRNFDMVDQDPSDSDDRGAVPGVGDRPTVIRVGRWAAMAVPGSHRCCPWRR